MAYFAVIVQHEPSDISLALNAMRSIIAACLGWHFCHINFRPMILGVSQKGIFERTNW